MMHEGKAALTDQYALAAMLYAYDELPDDAEEMVEWERHWRKILPSIAEDGHGGDCTKASGTCPRCAHDGYLKQAKIVAQSDFIRSIATYVAEMESEVADFKSVLDRCHRIMVEAARRFDKDEGEARMLEMIAANERLASENARLRQAASLGELARIDGDSL